MPKKIGKKVRWTNTKNKQKQKSFIRCLWFSFILLLVNLIMPASMLVQKVDAADCADVKIIFARGSGQDQWTGQDYLTFKNELSEKLKLTTLSYDFLDLDYPAIDVGNLWTLLTTFVGRGDAYEFGASVEKGAKNLINEVNNSSCNKMKYVLAGYSQGAMVVSKAAPRLDADKIIYAATFGDPKIYLPEGYGPMPDACRGANLSNYRIYVPDCQVYEGMLGSYRPYQPEALIDKMGTWCNHTDIFCSTYLSIKSHTSYVSDGLYADASKLIFDKITKALGVENKYVSLHDTAILIDSTGSMSDLIEKYKNEALRLAEKTLENGGRVALYDYRDVADGYEPHQRCSFETCTLESFKDGLSKISASGGGDTPESLLSAGIHVMKELDWNYGSTKSVVVLTDANYHNPDLDGTTFDDMVNLSKKIDPVNFYFIVPSYATDAYETLAAATDGGVVSSGSDLSLLTDNIVARYDSLPRVEEEADAENLPEILETEIEKMADGKVKISWTTTGTKTLVALNDYVLGITEGDAIVLEDLDLMEENVVTLMPLNESRRGKSVNLEISTAERGSLEVPVIPKAPNTGKR